MADTGPPWNLRFPGPQDFVRETNFYIEDLAEDTATALSAAGGLVAVKHVLKTDTFSASSIAAGASVAVTGLSITHALADENNRLIISAFFGIAANATSGGACGIAINDGTGLIALANAEGSRTRVTAGTDRNDQGRAVTFVHTPNTTDSLTYSVHAINIDNDPRTLHVNRARRDDDEPQRSRAASGFIIQEVKV